MGSCNTKISQFPTYSGTTPSDLIFPVVDTSSYTNQIISYDDLINSLTISLSGVGINTIWLTGTTLVTESMDGTLDFIDLSSLLFTGNTSGNCITEIWVTNVYGCSPVRVHTDIIVDDTISATTFYGDGNYLEINHSSLSSINGGGEFHLSQDQYSSLSGYTFPSRSDFDYHTGDTSNPHHTTVGILDDVNSVGIQDYELLVYLGGQYVPSPYNPYSGFITMTDPTDNTDGTLTISGDTVLLFPTDDFNGVSRTYNLTGGITNIDFSDIPDEMTSYVVGDYNGGLPKYSVITDVDLITESNVVPYLTLFREDTDLYWMSWDRSGLGLSNKLHQRMVKTERFARETGLILSIATGQTFNINTGIVWYGINRVVLSEFDSSVNTVAFYAHSGGTFYETERNDFDCLYYDNGNDLVELSGGYFTINWVYKFTMTNENEAGIILGSQQFPDYATASAYNTLPTSLPAHLQSMGILVGKIIVEKNVISGATAESAFNITFAGTSTTNHNDATGLQGGFPGEYYHLKAADYSDILNKNYTYKTEFGLHTGDTNNPHHTSFYNLIATAHTHNISEIIDLQTSLDNKSGISEFNNHTGNTSNPHQTSFYNLIATAHTHTISESIGLQTALDNKSGLSEFTSHTGDTSIHYTKSSISIFDLGTTAHTHSVSDVTGLQTTLNDKVNSSVFNSHTGDTTVHYTKSSILLSELGSSAHTHTLDTLSINIRTVTTTYTADTTDTTILVDAALAPITITLTNPVTYPKKLVIIKKIDATANAITLNSLGGATIDGDSDKELDKPMSAYWIQNNGSNWYLL